MIKSHLHPSLFESSDEVRFIATEPAPSFSYLISFCLTLILISAAIKQEDDKRPPMRRKLIFTRNSLNNQTWWWCKVWLIWLWLQLTISMTSEKFLLRSVTLNGCSLGCDDEAFSMSDVFTCEKWKKNIN